MSRRQFLVAALGAGAAASLPAPALEWAMAATGTGAPPRSYFLIDRPGHPRHRTCAALCARIVPTGADPVADPGATEAGAVVFIDRFLAAFELPAHVADHPAIWLRGRFSGRNPYPDLEHGRPARTRPADDMLDRSGRARFLPLTRYQELSWRALLYGPGVLAAAARRDPRLGRWAHQVAAGTIPGVPATGLRGLYAAGLDGFDAYSRQLFGTPFADASAEQQDLMIDAAGNPLVAAIPLPSPAPPAAAEALFPVLVAHTFAGCYSLPEYRWRHDDPLWRLIGFDGDTMPLGNSIYDASAHGPGAGPNAGFGEPGVYVPRGGYREYRPVSTPDPAAGAPLSAADTRRLLPIVTRVARGRSAR